MGPDVPCADLLRAGALPRFRLPLIHGATLRTGQVAGAAPPAAATGPSTCRPGTCSALSSILVHQEAPIMHPQKHAVPLVEFLVAIAVLLTLAGLLIFAVHKVSAAAAARK